MIPLRLGVLDLLQAAPNVEQTWVNDVQTIAYRTIRDARFCLRKPTRGRYKLAVWVGG